MSFGRLGIWILGLATAASGALAQPADLVAAPPERLPPVGVDRPLREMIDPAWSCVETSGPAQVALPSFRRGPGLTATAVTPELGGAAPPAPVPAVGPALPASGIQQVAYVAAPPQPAVRLAQVPEIGSAGAPAPMPAGVPTYNIDPRATALQSGRPLPSPDLDEFNYPLEHARAMTEVFDNMMFLVKAGVEDPLTGGFFGNHLMTGWGIQLGARRPWFGESERSGAWFGELFVGFGETGGDGPTELTPGAVADSTPGRVALIQVADAFDTQLRDLKRTTLSLGLGRYFAPRWGRVPGRTWQFMMHGGFQFGHAHARYLNSNTAAIDAVYQDRINGGSDPFSVNILYSFDNSDTYFGLYAGGGVALNWYNVSTWYARWRQVSVGVELDYVNQWIDLDGFSSPEASPLALLAPMATFTLGW